MEMNELFANEPLMKNRGVGATLKAAYGVFLAHLKGIFRCVWKPALVFAVLLALYSVFVWSNVESGDVSLFTLCLQQALFVVMILADVLVAATVLKMVNGLSVGRNAWRVVAATLSSMIISAVLVALTVAAVSMASDSTVKLLAVCGILGIIFLVVLVPLHYAYAKYCVDGSVKLHQVFGRLYLTGWRYWGYWFAVILSLFIISAVLTFVLFLPVLILAVAIALSAEGVAMGDPSGLPGGVFSVLTFAVYAIASFAAVFLFVYTVLTAGYACGTVDAREQERTEGEYINSRLPLDSDV